MKSFDISLSNFTKIRDNDKYFVDKSLFIKEYLDRNEDITLITRPRRFGKTTAMTMLADFFDIEKDSGKRFEGLKIMDTEYALMMNSRPVIALSFRECDGSTAENLRLMLNSNLFNAMVQMKRNVAERMDHQSEMVQKFLSIMELLKEDKAGYHDIANVLDLMIRVCNECYQMQPLVLIDEYDQPLLASYANGYHEKVKDFLAGFYTKGLKDNPLVYKALMTGIQRMAKESIFSKFNNPAIYTVMDEAYSTCFGFTEEETALVLRDAGLMLDDLTKEMYDGYRFAGTNIYNPSSIIGYAKDHERKSYWLNTSSNKLIHEAIATAGENEEFRLDYEELLEKGSVTVTADLTTSFMELNKISTLWGLLINAGYLTVLEKHLILGTRVGIPNKEVAQEFLKMIGEEMHASPNVLQTLFWALDQRNMDIFQKLYQRLVLTCTSYYDGKENAYHMFFLGMCVFLKGKYKITSNLESGYGRHDIILEPLSTDRKPIIVEFKQVKADEIVDLTELANVALKQIKDQKYYASLKGNILLVGIAHQVKKCEMVYEEFMYDPKI